MLEEAPPPSKIPVAQVTVGAYRFVFHHLGLFADLAWLPFLILLAASLTPAWLPLVMPDGATENVILEALPDFGQLVIGAFCLNAFTVRWNQAVLFQSRAETLAQPWRKPWLRFLLYTLCFYLVNLAGLGVIGLVATMFEDSPAARLAPAIVGLALVLPIWLGAARLSLLFPATAAGQPLGLKGAWRSLRGNTWRLVACGFLACAPLLLAVVLIMGGVVAVLRLQSGEQVLDDPPMGLFLIQGVVGTLADFIIAAFGATILAEAYKRLVRALET
jgi:hypothetical protein